MNKLGILLIGGGLLIIVLIFGPVTILDFSYRLDKAVGVKYAVEADPDRLNTSLKIITPVSYDFGIVIPKINVNSEIFPQVDPTNPDEYLPILKKGVAQAKESNFPDEIKGNLFLFAHSTDSFYNLNSYNTLFYLIGKLEVGDEIDVFYNSQRYLYEVTKIAVVTPDQLNEYVQNNIEEKAITLESGYPSGMTLKRLVVIGKLSSD